MRSVRNALFATFALAAVACTAPGTDEEVSDGEGELASALSRGDAPMSDAAFLPSSSAEVGSWAAYTVGSNDRTPNEMLFVNHAESGPSIVVSVNVARDEVKIVGAPADGSGAPLLKALLEDLAVYDDASGASGSVRPQSRLTTEAAKSLLARAATKLKVSGDALVTAITNYTGAGYQGLNQFLREGIVPSTWSREAAIRESRTLFRALRRLPPVTAESHRWVSVGVGAEARANPQKLGRFLESVKPGSLYQDRGFMSTSLDKSMAAVSGYPNFRFDIKGKTGRDVSMLSIVPSENEVLFAPRTRFRVVSVKGEFVAAPERSYEGPSAEEWRQFVTATSQYFPGVSKATIDRELANGKIPNVVVKLEELAAP